MSKETAELAARVGYGEALTLEERANLIRGIASLRTALAEAQQQRDFEKQVWESLMEHHVAETNDLKRERDAAREQVERCRAIDVEVDWEFCLSQINPWDRSPRQALINMVAAGFDIDWEHVIREWERVTPGWSGQGVRNEIASLPSPTAAPGECPDPIAQERDAALRERDALQSQNTQLRRDRAVLAEAGTCLAGLILHGNDAWKARAKACEESISDILLSAEETGK